MVVIASKSSGYGVLGKCITLACRGANHDNLEGYSVLGGLTTPGSAHISLLGAFNTNQKNAYVGRGRQFQTGGNLAFLE